MNFTSQDISVIEKSLQHAIRSEQSEMKAAEFREVLQKLQVSSMKALQLTSEAEADESSRDGFRYDYDDSSDLM
ncbi:hypothetical protein [Paenibacillus lutrae]|uniref:Uncharacterized protein n=1 Tax=Paenibacillus lutrae TaxID=2078573 RepID=A0A7X3FJ23_9BACL|nr:hypothetical protein [Paenibacillus lutrae]MVP00409.1 hypothetical protein [Paenibacillus lutrae]